MTCRRVGNALLLLATLVSLLPWAVPAAAALDTKDTNIRIVRLSYVNGDVQLDRRQGQGYEQAILNMPIVQGSRLWTRGEDALAEVEFEDGSSLRLTPGSSVEFQELLLRGSGEKATSVELESGTAYFDIRSHMGDFTVTSGGQQISVTHPARFRVFGGNGDFKVAVYKGSLNVRSGDNQIAVLSGETFTLDSSDPRHYNLAKSIAEGSYDDWNQERARYALSYTSASTYTADSYSNSFSPAYSYGLADLAYYGNYSYAPGWGWMWRPYYVGAAWNPFMDGSWAWYPQFGYAWVSPYPWGWMPYRYGAWNFVPGYGWGWMPGPTWNRWAPVTGVNHPPVGWAAPHAPLLAPQPGSPGIVTVGRGWHAAYPSGSPVGTGLLPSAGTTPRRGWSGVTPASAWVPNNGVVTNGTTTASPTVAAPAARPVPPPAVGVSHGNNAARVPPPMRTARPAASTAAPHSQMSPSGGHSWGGGAASSSGHSSAGGASVSHGGGHR
jgi:hypothetical protein